MRLASIIILSFGRGERFRTLVDDLLAEGVPAETIVVVHNPYSPHDSWVPRAPDGVAVHRMPDNLGYGGAMNVGIALVADKSAAVLLLTHDSRLDPHAFSALMAALGRASTFGVLAPAIELSGDTAIVSYGGTVTKNGTVTHLEGIGPVDRSGVSEVPWVDGCAMLVRIDAIRRVGPLNATYFMYFEEPEFCDRMRACGWRVGVVPGARAHSETGLASRPAAFGYLYARNGFAWARSCRGRVFAACFLVRQMRASWDELPKPGGRRFKTAAPRLYGFRLAIGRSLGLIAGLRGVSGPPPDFLARTGDMHETTER